MPHRVVSATEFRLKCLATLDEIGKRGGTVTVTKRARAVAHGRSDQKEVRNPEGIGEGQIEIVGDIVNLNSSGRGNILEGPGRQL